MKQDAYPSASPLHFFTPRERVIYLRSLPDFSGVPLEAILALAQHLDEDHLRGGEQLNRHDRRFDEAFFLVDGGVGFYRDGERIGGVEAPGTVAVIALLANLGAPPGDVITEGATQLLRLDGRTLIHLWEANFELLASSLRVVTGQVLDARHGMPFDPDNVPRAESGEAPEQRLDFVDRLRWQVESMPFADANLDAVGELARQQTEVHFAEGDVLWSPGDESDHFLGIVHGMVNCEARTVINSEALAGTVGAGHTIGMFDALAGREREYRATATTDVVALRTDLDRLLAVLEDQFGLARRMLASQASHAVRELWERGPS